MIKNARLVEHMKKDFISKQKLPYKQSLKIFESMWDEGVKLDILLP